MLNISTDHKLMLQLNTSTGKLLAKFTIRNFISKGKKIQTGVSTQSVMVPAKTFSLYICKYMFKCGGR
jgi:hypothetical protein